MSVAQASDEPRPSTSRLYHEREIAQGTCTMTYHAGSFSKLHLVSHFTLQGFHE